MGPPLRKLVCFNLPENADERDVEDVFGKHGKLAEFSIRRQGGSNMAFVEYQDARDAEDALRDRHGSSFSGNRLRVEYSRPKGKGKGKNYSSRGRDNSRGRGRPKGGDSRGRRQRQDSRGGRSKGGGKAGLKDSYFKVRVVGMPASASWQDLKDFLRGVGTVKFTEIVEPGVGVGGFVTHAEARDAVLDLDDKKFSARNGDTAHVRVEDENKKSGGRDSGRSRRSPHRSRSRGRGRSHSRSC